MVKSGMNLPKRPPSHSTGDIAQKKTDYVLSTWGWVVGTIASDYGEDLECNIFESSQRTNLYFRVQVKSSLLNGGGVYKNGDYRVRVSSSTCWQWFSEFFPVILVFHDAKSDELFWCDALSFIRDQSVDLSKSGVTFRISKQKKLEGSKGDILSLVEKFYASLLKIASPQLVCEVYPLLMPGYRTEAPVDLFLDFEDDQEVSGVAISKCSSLIDDLPGWLTPVSMMNPPYVSCYKLSKGGVELGEFIRDCHSLVVRFARAVPAGTWIAFVWSPIRFRGPNQNQHLAGLLQHELTTWESWSLLGGKLVLDRRYAFEYPRGFVRTIGRHARSWDGYYLVSRVDDIAVELFAPAVPNPSDFSRKGFHEKAIRAQLLPWQCLEEDVEKVAALVAEADLVFNGLPDIKLPEGFFAGAIAPFLTDPQIGAFSLPLNWAEFDLGIRGRLESLGILSKLPGEEGPEESSVLLEKMFSRIYEKPQNEVLIAAPNHRKGLPLNQAKRVILVSRFRRELEVPASEVFDECVLEDCKKRVEAWATVNYLELEPIPSFDKWVSRVTLSLTPSIDLSSIECIEKVLGIVVEVFDKLVGRSSAPEVDTFSTLHLDGELYFEGHERFMYY